MDKSWGYSLIGDMFVILHISFITYGVIYHNTAYSITVPKARCWSNVRLTEGMHILPIWVNCGVPILSTLKKTTTRWESSTVINEVMRITLTCTLMQQVLLTCNRWITWLINCNRTNWTQFKSLHDKNPHRYNKHPTSMLFNDTEIFLFSNTLSELSTSQFM